MNKINSSKITIKDEFWCRYTEMIREKTIPYQWKVLNDQVEGVDKSAAIENFKIAAGEKTGEFFGYRFQDSDVAKWLETVAYSLAAKRDEKLEALVDETIDLIGRTQQDDGYLVTKFIISKQEKRYTDLSRNHELYISGHMMEAAVAYFEATGKKKFLEIMCRNADHLCDTFGVEDSKIPGYPGHQVVEMALVRLFEVTGEKRYLELSKYFIDQRGKKPNYILSETKKRGESDVYSKHFGDKLLDYLQAHESIDKQKVATGHAVRAVYMYSAIVDLAARYNDKKLINASLELWNNVTRKQMFITGGIGSQNFWEGFSFDYDLPNSTTYNETCASIGLVFWARRMNQLELNGEYDDILEQILYNGLLSGISLDGTKYFYVNPLEINPQTARGRKDTDHVEPNRRGWFGCACCPPNIARLIASIAEYIYSYDEDTLVIHQYISNKTSLSLNNESIDFEMRGSYLKDGKVKIDIYLDKSIEFAVKLRVPRWCDGAVITVNSQPIEISTENGYCKIDRKWQSEDSIEIDFPMQVKIVRSNPKVQTNAGKAAIMRGPVVYCLEETDNGPLLSSITFNENTLFNEIYTPDLLEGITVLEFDGFKESDGWGDELYRTKPKDKKKIKLMAVPYYAWNNRGEGEMMVWIREQQ
jgi:uncharacterized protein